MQIHQLSNYIANIGEQNYPVSLLSHQLQTLIHDHIFNALSYGVNAAMLLNAMVCLVATLVCVRMLKK